MKTIPQSLSKVYVHITFSTKNRVPIIKSEIQPVADKQKEATEQLQTYLKSPELQDFVVRDEGGLETVKAYAIVFVGEKTEIVEEVK